MRKISLLMLFALAFLFNANATNLFTGDHAITWKTPLDLEAEKFADAKAGDKIVMTYTGATDGVEFKVIGVWQHIAGSCSKGISGDGSMEQFLTPKAVADIQAHGLQIIGENFHCTSVDLVDGKAELKEETTIWTGYFWADNWSTMELYLDGEAIDWSQYKEMVIYHEAHRSDFVVNILSQFDKEGAKVPEGAIAKYNDKIVVDLRQVDMNAVIAAAEEGQRNTLKFQFNKEQGLAFNVTDITLVKETRIYNGNKHVSWKDGGLQITADKFAGAQTGNLLKVHYANAATNIEFKAMNTSHDNLAGSRKNAWIEGEGVYEMYLSTLAVGAVKAYGLEICGGGFDVTEVELLEGRAAEAKDGSIWTGYSWADNVCKTLELDIEGFHHIDWYDYKQMIVYHQAGHTDYGVNVRTNWDSEGVIYETIAADKSADKIVIDLTKVDIPAIIAATNADRLMIQGCSSGEAFNITDIVLVMEEPYTRTVTNGNYGTICLPRASAVIEGATMYSIVDGNASEGITIEEVASMEAGKPYIFEASADQLTVTMTGARADVQAANGLIGNLGGTAMDVPQDAYVLKNNKLYLVDNTSVTIAPNRAYIDLSGITTLAPAPGMKRRVIAAENQATGVDKVPSDQVQTTKVLLNGQLFILRGGQLFDATGARVQ